MNRYIKSITLLFILILSASIEVSAKVTMRVEMPKGKSSIEVGDIFWIWFSDPSFTEDYWMLNTQFSNVPGTKILNVPEPRYNRKADRIEFVMTLRAKEEGKFKFGPISANGANTNAVTYVIKKGSSKSSDSNSSYSQNTNNAQGPTLVSKGDDRLFLKASVSKTTVYEQEAIVYTVKLYTTYADARFMGCTATPSFDGFTVDVSDDVSTSYKFEEYEGRNYKTAVVARYILFPQVTGNLKVGTNTYIVNVTGYDTYYDPFQGELKVPRNVQHNLIPNELEVDVKPLPTPRPANFSGAVGTFKISSSLPSQKFATNHVASIFYTVSGHGNLKYLKLPDINALYPTQLEVMDATGEVNSKISNGALSGNVKFECPFIPLETGEYTIPDIEFVYFNPQTGQYETSTARGYKISVEKGKDSDKSQTKIRAKFDDTFLSVSVASASHSPAVRNLLYWLVYLLQIVFVAVVLYLYRRRLKELSNLDLLRSKKAGSVARKRLKKAYSFMQKGESEQFYTEMLTATWGFLSDRLHIPQSELNRENIYQALMDAGCDELHCQDLITLLDDCEFAKYAPSADGMNMQAVYERGASLLNHFANTINVRKS